MVDPHIVYTVPKAHKATNAPTDLLYQSLRDGRLKGVRRGRTWLIGGAALIAFLEKLGDEEMP